MRVGLFVINLLLLICIHRGGLTIATTVLFFSDKHVTRPDSGLTRKQYIWKLLRDLDLPGVTLLLGALICFFMACGEGGVKAGREWNSSTIIGLLVGSGVLTIALIINEYFHGQFFGDQSHQLQS